MRGNGIRRARKAPAVVAAAVLVQACAPQQQAAYPPQPSLQYADYSEGGTLSGLGRSVEGGLLGAGSGAAVGSLSGGSGTGALIGGASGASVGSLGGLAQSTAPPQRFVAFDPMRGAWSGSYACRQGMQDFGFILTDASSGTDGYVVFVPPRMNPGAGHGMATVRRAYDPYSGAVTLRLDRWLRQPAGYTGVDWQGTVMRDGSIQGRTVWHSTGMDCGGFRIARDGGVPASSVAEIERDPSRFVSVVTAKLDQSEAQRGRAYAGGSGGGGLTTGQVIGGIAVIVTGYCLLIGGCLGASRGGSGHDDTAPVDYTGSGGRRNPRPDAYVPPNDPPAPSYEPPPKPAIHRNYEVSPGVGNTGPGVGNTGPGLF